MSATELYKTQHPRAALDEAHIGDIRGALGTIRHCDIAPRRRLRTLLAILGPGLIVMVGDNDAGAIAAGLGNYVGRTAGVFFASP
jgi:hypothetical protein